MNDKALGTHATHPDRYVGLFVGAKIDILSISALDNLDNLSSL